MNFMEQVTVDRKVIVDMARLLDEVQLNLESLELMSDPDFMAGHERVKEQIKNRDFGDWDDI